MPWRRSRHTSWTRFVTARRSNRRSSGISTDRRCAGLSRWRGGAGWCAALWVVGTLSLGRFARAASGLDTGSPFGGMGAGRDMTIAALAEPALMLGLFASALAARSMNLGVLVRTLGQEGVTLHPA